MGTVSYKNTKIACYMGYVTQAIAVNLLPLLYVTLQQTYSISLAQLGLLATVLFVVQILVDFLAVRFGKHLSYRVGCIAAHVCATVGLVLIAVLPPLLTDSYVGILLAAILMSVGGGLIEVLISPVVDAIPAEGKAGAMSLLHSFYCWGVVGVVLLSTLFFVVFGTAAWQWLVLLWALVPLLTTLLFTFVPLPPKPEKSAEQTDGRPFFRTALFWLLMMLMLCAGATELGVAQWASLFAEQGLRISKTLGDLMGPCAFALFQGISRVVYARLSTRYDGRRILVWHAVGCVGAYALIALSPWPPLSLFGFCLCGWCVGPMWPGVLSLSSTRYPVGGTAMFAALALCGDVGCSLAPAMVGAVSDALQHDLPTAEALRYGFGVCLIFPMLLLIGLVTLRNKRSAERGFFRKR